MHDTVGMMDILGQGQSLGADAALVPGMILIALDFGELTVLDHELKTAPAV